MPKETFSVQIKSTGVTRLLRRFNDIHTKGVPKALSKGTYSIDDAISDWQDVDLDPRIQERLKGIDLKSRTGHLAQSINAQNSTLVLEGTENLELTYKSKVPYAHIHEKGGKIEPVSAKYLKIPFKHDKPSLRNLTSTKSGVHRPNFNKDDTFIARSKAGNLIIFLNRNKKIVPLYVLKKSVKIPASHWFENSVDDTEGKLKPRLVRSLNSLIKGTR